MPKVSEKKWAELEGFWRHHHEGWKSSALNQREYCELHGLPLKRFGNWRDRFKAEEKVQEAGLLYRHGGLGHMPSHMTDRENGPVSTGYIPSSRTLPEARRNFRMSDKKRIAAEAMAPSASVSGVARRYGIIAGGLAPPALLAHVLISKYCDHLPLYRQSQMFARQGVGLERSTLAGWVGGACWWLDALHVKLAENVLACDHLFADDTPLPVLDPGRRRTKTGRFWVYAREQRGWSGSDPPAAIYIYEPDRRAERPKEHLRHYHGTLHVDGYAGFEQLTGTGKVVLAACWAHTRRKFYEIAKADGSPIALEAVRRIAELYAIETRNRGMAPVERLAVRQAMTQPLVADLKHWLESQLVRVPQRGKLAEAIRYALTRWTGLCRFLDDGCVELDTNPVERAIRPVALGRKNHLFAGSDRGARRWATVASLVETAKLNGTEPYAYLADVLQRMADGHPANRLDELLPWRWKPKIP